MKSSCIHICLVEVSSWQIEWRQNDKLSEFVTKTIIDEIIEWRLEKVNG